MRENRFWCDDEPLDRQRKIAKDDSLFGVQEAAKDSTNMYDDLEFKRKTMSLSVG